MRKTSHFVTVVALFSALSSAVDAQQPMKIPRIGALHLGTSKAAEPVIEAFQRGLRELGYTPGSSVTLDYRYAEGKSERYAALASELVALKPALILVWGTDVAEAVKKATSTVPVIFALADRPDLMGLVSSLAHPGGNLTGVTSLNFELSTKRLELLKETIPELTRVGFLGMHHPLNRSSLKDAEPMARSLGIQLQMFEFQRIADLDGIFGGLRKDRPGALLLLPGRALVYGPPTASLALNQHMPTITSHTEITDTGGLMSYGPRITDMSFRAATYVDKILKGAKPGELPVEQPTTFDFVVNLKTAKRIGLTIPPNVLARADRVIK
jgi:putative tryptophan/tyrosine transport system substrate-binding protein